jgi:hypothetical protein
LDELDEFAEEMPVWLMDNCPSIHYECCYAIALLIETRVRVITFLPHTEQHSDLSSARCEPLCCSQVRAKIQIVFRRRQSDR